MCDGNLLIN